MRAFLRTWVDAFNEHRLLVYATAIAMRALIGLAGLAFLTIALLGATGERKIWEKARRTGGRAEADPSDVRRDRRRRREDLREQLGRSDRVRVALRRLAGLGLDPGGDGRAQLDRRARRKPPDAVPLRALGRARRDRDPVDRLRTVRRGRVEQAAGRKRRDLALAGRRPALAGGSRLPRPSGRNRRAPRAGRAPRLPAGRASGRR